jgi:general secretion pathway protein C
MVFVQGGSRVFGPETPHVPAAGIAAKDQDVGRSDSPLDQLARLPLFGTLQVPVEIPAVELPDAPLRLQLLGVMMGETPDRGLAVIAEAGHPDRLYSVGDVLAGGKARLHQIYPDRVLLEHADGFATLPLPRLEHGVVLNRHQDGHGSHSGSGDSAGPSAGSAADSLTLPQTAGEPIRILRLAEPVFRDGALYGLEVRHTRSVLAFRDAGLFPGDLILSVNGVPASTLKSGDLQIQDLLRDHRLDLVIERKGQIHSLNMELVPAAGLMEQE